MVVSGMATDRSREAGAEDVGLACRSQRARPICPGGSSSHASRTLAQPSWLEHGQWVLVKREVRFGRVQGELRHSARTVFEVIVCSDGTRYLVPLEDLSRALRPLAGFAMAERMLRCLSSRTSEIGLTIAALRMELQGLQCGECPPDVAASLLRGCYRNQSLRSGETKQQYLVLERLVLTEIALACGLEHDALRRNVRAAHGIVT